MAEQKKEEAEPEPEQDEYDGPWIEKRIEWKCPDRKRHNVVLFGSWNRFKGGDELEYQGKQVFACNVKLPLGTYVYRFLIDQEEWETDYRAGKTARNGIEYNQISVTEDSDDEDDDEFNADDDGNQEEEEQGNTALIIGADGKMTVGKKRRGRPSVELDLGQNFAANDEDADDGDADELEAPDEGNEEEATTPNGTETTDNDTATDSGSATAGGAGGGKDGGKKKKKKKKKKKLKSGKKGDKEQDKEWAKYVFVQQLRLQQQHNDEINRVKTLWKQERQVRIEMHKKVVKQLKDTKTRMQEMEVEISRLEKTAKIGTSSEDKMSSQLKVELEKLRDERTKLQDEIRAKEKEFSDYRKTRIEEEKQLRDTKGDWESSERKYKQEISGYKSQIDALKQTQSSLEANLSALKDGNSKTMELKQQQYVEREEQFKREHEEFDASKKELKSVKKQCKQLEKDVSDEQEIVAALNKKLTAENAKFEEAQTKIKSLEGSIDELRNSTEAAEKIQIEVNRVKAEKDAETKLLSDKVVNTEKQMAEQKSLYEQRLKETTDLHTAEITALKSNSDAAMTEMVEKLKTDIAAKNDELSSAQGEVAKLGASLSEEKTNNESLTSKNSNLDAEIAALTERETALKTQMEELQTQTGATTEELKALQNSSAATTEEQRARIEKLESELDAARKQSEEETKTSEEKIAGLEQKIEELQTTANEKSAEVVTLTDKLSEAQQQIEAGTNAQSALDAELTQLREQLASEQQLLATKEAEFSETLSKLQSDLEREIADKDAKLKETTDALNEKEAELSTKMAAYANAEAEIEALKVDLEAQRQNLENEKTNSKAAVAVYVAKEERIQKQCKSVFAKFAEIRNEMKSVQEQQISQLEEVSKFFGDFAPLLSKVLQFNQTMIDDLLTKYKRELSLRRKYFNMVQDLRGNIRVFCRFRPLLPFELKKNYTECVKFPHEGLVEIVDDKGKTLKFDYDQVYVPSTSQAQVSEDTTEYIQSVMDGYNVSIFAYGQTGSGKTFTMEGPKENPGVNLRALKHLFKISEERHPQFQYKIKVSILEIYNERIHDLIKGSEKVLGIKIKGKKGDDKKKDKKKDDFKIRHLPDGSVEVEGLTKIPVTSDDDILKLNAYAKKNRSMTATKMNEESSRSHMLMVVDVSGINIPANIKYFGKLYLVDLAGSERVKKSGATGQSLEEAKNINKSLSALGGVMQSLQNKDKFIPYRNSKLTELMSNALGGNAKTIMFINCCPASEHAFETVSSLKFAQRVGKVELGAAKQNKDK